MLDLLIIGGGPVGIATALEAKKKKLNYRVIEQGTLVNSIFNFPSNMRFFSTSEKLEIDGIPFSSVNPKPTRKEGMEYFRKVAAAHQLKINLFEKVKEVSGEWGNFIVSSSKTTYRTKNVVVATGFYGIPNYVDVPGEELDKVSHYYNDPHQFYDRDVIVVGASNSACDAALEIFRKGGRVTLIVRGKAIGKRVKYWVKPDIENRIKEGSIDAFFNANITEIGEEEVTVKLETGELKTFANDAVLLLTGYQPNFEFLRALDIRISQDERSLPKFNPRTMETNRKGIYLAGVLCAGAETHKLLIENSLIHAKLLVENITKRATIKP